MGLLAAVIVLICIFLVICMIKFAPAYGEKFSDEINEGKVQSVSVPKPAPKAPPRMQPTPAPTAAPVPAPAAVKAQEDTQLAAVIMAAVMMAMEQEGTPAPAGGLVIRSIRKRF